MIITQELYISHSFSNLISSLCYSILCLTLSLSCKYQTRIYPVFKQLKNQNFIKFHTLLYVPVFWNTATVFLNSYCIIIVPNDEKIILATFKGKILIFRGTSLTFCIYNLNKTWWNFLQLKIFITSARKSRLSCSKSVL